jgi:hypothetical protein
VNRFRPLARPQRRTSWGPKPEQPEFCRYESTHGQHPYEPSILLRARFATSVRVRKRRPERNLTESSRCLRSERDQRPDEEPCPLRLSLRSISRPSLSRSSTLGFHPRLRVDAPANELEECRSVPGTARHATWVAAPKRRLLSAIPAVEVPSFEIRGHPVSSLESASMKRFSLHEPERLGGRAVFSRGPRPWGKAPPRRERPTRRAGVPGTLRRKRFRRRVTPRVVRPVSRSRGH